MKKMFFYANFRVYDETVGITQKVKKQIEAFQELGYDVIYSGYLEDGVAIFDNTGNILVKKKYFFKNGKINHILRRYMLLLLCKDYFLKNDLELEFSYLRYHFFDSFYINLLKVLKKKSKKVIMEAHSYPVFVKKDRFNPIKILDEMYSKKAHKYCDYIASMTNLKTIYEIPTYEIENTLNIDDFKIKKYKRVENKFILINVAFENITHGLDRLIKGISNYYKTIYKTTSIDIELLLIGEYSNSTKKLVEDLSLSEKVKFLGKMKRNEIDTYIDEAHFAVGSMGNHRANSYYGSALKTKEYIARGIPFVYGWEERILINFPFAYKVPLNEEPVDIKKILEFYRKIENKDLAIKMRKFLEENNRSWQQQFYELLKFRKD
jgi:glycosyltransferase, family 1